MKKVIITFCFLTCVAFVNAASLELEVMKQKTLPNGNTYGLPSGIYFKPKDLHPFVMYKLQYSEDLKKWTDMVYLGTHAISMTSPFYTWDELPPHSCFFRIVEAW